MHNQTEDQKVESYLKRFRPLPPAPLPQRKRRWRFVPLSAAAAGVIAVLALLPEFRKAPPAPAEPQPITIGSANELLANTSSWKSVIDDSGFAFRASSTQPPRKYQSALEFLGQEHLSK